MQRIRHPASSTNGIIWISTKMSVVAANNDDRPVVSDTPQIADYVTAAPWIIAQCQRSFGGTKSILQKLPKADDFGVRRTEDPAHFSCVLASLGKAQLPDAVRTKRVTSSAPSDGGRCF